MSEISLMIQPADIIALNTFDGNIDVDNLKPMIYVAQTTHLKSFLGLKLYTKIYNDFVTDALDGEYKTIFDEYIIDFLSYYSSSLFVTFASVKVSENGLHRVSSEGIASVDYSESEKLSMKYIELVTGVQSNFKEYVSDKNIPELNDDPLEVETSFPWH
jgi:hypothetical protein